MIDLRNKKQGIVIGIILFLLITDIPQEPKKQGAGNVFIGVVGIIGGVMLTGSGFPLIGIPTMLASLGLMGAGITQTWLDIFRPQPTIPMWVWAVGFFILILFVLKRK